jgi:hypothetical protein
MILSSEMLHKDYDRKSSVGRESQGACRQDKLIGSKPWIWADSQVVSELDNLWGSVVVSCCFQKLVPEAEDRSGTHRKGNVHRWKHREMNPAFLPGKTEENKK